MNFVVTAEFIRTESKKKYKVLEKEIKYQLEYMNMLKLNLLQQNTIQKNIIRQCFEKFSIKATLNRILKKSRTFHLFQKKKVLIDS